MTSEIEKVLAHAGGLDAILRIYSEGTKAAGRRLVNDPRMKDLWHRAFGVLNFLNAVQMFERAHSRGAWEHLSAREQNRWIEQFDKTIEKLTELMKKAPRPPEQWGFPVRSSVLVDAARRMGLPGPPDVTTNSNWNAVMEEVRLEEAVDAVPWTIIDSLRHFQMQQHEDAKARQRLSKPGDAKAARAFFLSLFQEVAPDVSASDVATVATVMFEEEVDDRKVREHRPAGLSRSPKNPS